MARSFTRRGGAGQRVILSDHINELQAALEADDVRIDDVATDVTAKADAAAVTALTTTVASKPDTDAVVQALGAASGASITNIRPGRIDARVRGLSTVASNNSTALQALLAESASTGAEVWLPEGTYKATVEAASNARLNGRGAIQGVGGNPALYLRAGLNGFDVSGIALDGAGVRACVYGSGGTAGQPISGVSLRGVRFRNTAPSGVTDAVFALRDGIGMVDTVISGCVFEATVGGGVYIQTPNHLQITGNRFAGTSNHNFVYIALYAGKAWGGGDGIVIADNVGVGGARMAVEVYNDTGGAAPFADAPIIANNWFDVSGGSYGISTPACQNGVVSGNTLIGTATYGMEIVGVPVILTNNTVVGFSDAIILNSAPRCTVQGNIIANASRGIVATTSTYGPSVMYSTIRDNVIIDPLTFGIWLGQVSPGISGYDVVENNLIYRSQVAADDAGRTFVGLQLSAPTNGPRYVRQNRIIQAAASPTLTDFRAIVASSTNTQPTEISKNVFVNQSGSAFGKGVHGNSGAVSLTGMDIFDNTYTNLSLNITAGVAVRQSQRGMTATATLDFPSIAAGATANLTITVSGAAVGDSVHLGPPATLEAGLVATAYVSAASTVTVRLANVTTGAIDPASATWRATVMRVA